MDIEQFRAIKAQESAKVEEPVKVVEETKVDETKVEEVKVEETKPIEKIVIDGVGELTIDEIKNGYLRQSDYTKKTQDLSKTRQENEDAIAVFNYIKSNPELAKQLSMAQNAPVNITPEAIKIKELEDKIYDMIVSNEINALSSKYSDFDVSKVLSIADEKGITNLEDAYKLSISGKSQENQIDEASLKEKLRKEILDELAVKEGTQTLISPRNSSVKSEGRPTMTSTEVKIARGMNMTDAEYIKWRDAK